MNRSQKLLSLLLGVLILGNVFFWVRMNEDLKNLEHRILSVPSGASSFELNSVKEEITELLKKDASILSFQNVSIEAEEGALVCRLKVVPKELKNGEKVFFTLEGLKQEAVTTDRAYYEGEFLLTKPGSLQSVVSFESKEGVRMESLNVPNVRDVMRFQVETALIRTEGEPIETMELRIHADVKESLYLLDHVERVTGRLLNPENDEVLLELPGKFVRREGKMAVYHLDLRDINKQTAVYAVDLVMETTLGWQFVSPGSISWIDVFDNIPHFSDSGMNELMLDWHFDQ